MPNISPDSKPIHYVCLLDALPQCDLPIFYSSCSYFGLLEENGFLNRSTIHHLDLWKLQATCNKKWFELLRSNTLKISFHHMSISAYSNPFNLSCQTGARKMVYQKNKTESTNPNAETETTWKLQHSYSQLLQLLYYSTYSAYSTLSYLIDTLLKYCTCHAKRKNDLPAWKLEVAKNISRETSFSFDSSKLKIDHFLHVLMAFAKLPPLFTKCCPCHDFWHCVGRGDGKTQTLPPRMSQNATKARYLRGNRRPAHQADHMFVTFCERRPTVRLCGRLPGCGRSSNPGRTWLQPPSLASAPSSFQAALAGSLLAAWFCTAR